MIFGIPSDYCPFYQLGQGEKSPNPSLMLGLLHLLLLEVSLASTRRRRLRLTGTDSHWFWLWNSSHQPQSPSNQMTQRCMWYQQVSVQPCSLQLEIRLVGSFNTLIQIQFSNRLMTDETESTGSADTMTPFIYTLAQTKSSFSLTSRS